MIMHIVYANNFLVSLKVFRAAFQEYIFLKPFSNLSQKIKKISIADYNSRIPLENCIKSVSFALEKKINTPVQQFKKLYFLAWLRYRFSNIKFGEGFKETNSYHFHSSFQKIYWRGYSKNVQYLLEGETVNLVNLVMS